jgi:two-component system, OmpR family, response regulator ChvI
MTDADKALMNKKILVVDDEADVWLGLKAGLEGNGFEVVSFKDPILALENFKIYYYDLVILDVKMPKMNGFELYREIRKLDDKVNVCFLTAGEMYYGMYADIFDALDDTRFIRKPIENKELIRRINAIMLD